MPRKTGFILAAIVAVIIAALAVAPSFVDWTRYKGAFAERIEQRLGRAVVIDGPVSLSLLPQPALTAQGVRLANIEGASTPEMAKVRSLSARLRLLPLITGRFELSSLILASPEIDFERLSDGRVNWRFQRAAPSPADGAPTPPSAASSPPAPPDDGERIGAVAIEDGVIVYRRPGLPPLALDKVDATLTLDGNAAHAKGRAVLNGAEVDLDGAAGPPDGDGSSPASLTMRLTDGAAELHLGGMVARDGFRGKLAVKGPDLPRAVRELGGETGEMAAARLPGGAFLLGAQVTSSPHQVEANGLAITCAGIDATGYAGVNLDAPLHVDLTLSAARLDVDSWRFPANPTASPAGAPTASLPASLPASQPATPAGQPTAPAGFFPAFTLPKGFSAAVDLGAEAVVIRGSVLRGAHVNASLANGELTLNQAGVALPGNSEINLFGMVAAHGGVPAFDGSFEGSTDDLRALLDWLKVDVSAVPPDRLRVARVAGKVKAQPAEVGLDGVELRLDGTKIDAAATLRPGARLAVGATIAVDTLNADAYWPSHSAPPTSPLASPPASPPVSPPGAAPAAAPAAEGATPLRWLDAVDANVSGRIGQLVVHRVTATDVAFDGSWLAGQLAVHSLTIADLAGAQLRVDGAVDGLSTGRPAVHGLHYDLRSQQIGRLLHQAGIAPSFDFARLDPATLMGTVDGGADGISLDCRNEAGGAQVTVSGRVEKPFDAPSFDLRVEAAHPSTTQLVQWLAPSYQPAARLGPFTASVQVAGDPNSLALSDLKVTAGPVAVKGGARLSFAAKPRIDATLSAGEVPLAAFLPVRRAAANTDRELSAKAAVPAGGDPAMAAPRPAVVTSGLAEHWSRVPLDLGWMKSFDLALKLDAQALVLGRTRLDAAALGLTLTDGVATVDRLAAGLYGGNLTGSGHLSADGGAALQLALSHARMRDALAGVADVDIADGLMDGEASLATSGNSDAEMVGRLHGTAKVSVTDGAIRGFDLGAADARLKTATNPIGLLTLVQAGLTGGKTSFSSLTGSFRAEGGLVTSDDIALAADGGSAQGTMQVNLPAYVMESRIQFRLASAPSGPPLVMRLTGTLDAPRRFIDINELESWVVQRTKALKGKGADPDSGQGGQPKGGDPIAKAKPLDMLKGLLKNLGR